MKKTKGCYGYIEKQRKYEIIKTILCFAISILIYVMGYITTGTNKNLLTIVAVLGCLPASKSAVSMIMFLKAKGCSNSFYQSISQKITNCSVLYDLYFTSYQKNYQISILIIKSGSICGFSESEKCDTAACEKHIGEMLMQNGHSDYVVKVFKDYDKFENRALQMDEQEEKHPKSILEIEELMRSIAL